MKRYKVLICTVVLVLCSSQCFAKPDLAFESDTCSLDTNFVRQYPYPFGNIVSYASDVEGQTPELGQIFHRFANYELGLPISDSMWVQAYSPLSSAFFISLNQKLNRKPLTSNNVQTYFQLLRDWYRGNIDHFHSWQDGQIPVFRVDFTEPLVLSSSGDSRSIATQVGKGGYETPHLFRVFTSGFLGANSDIILSDQMGKELVLKFSEAGLSQPLPQNSSGTEANSSNIYEWDFLNEKIVEKSAIASFDFRALMSLSVVDRSCLESCVATIDAVELSAFSRQTVLQQMKWLVKHNITPNYITSHGGFDVSHNYSNSFNIRKSTSPYITQNISYKQTLSEEGNLPFSPNFHTDLLEQLGVETIWAIESGSLVSPVDPHRAIRPLINTKFYAADRSSLGVSSISETPDILIKNIQKMLPDFILTPEEIMKLRDSYCGLYCAAQGDGVALEIQFSLLMMSRLSGVEHFWSNHFSSGGDRNFLRRPNAPYRPQTYKALSDLAASYHGWDGDFPKNRRPWVTSASTWVRYQMVRSQLEEFVVKGSGTEVFEISPWLEPQLKRLIPDAEHPSSDLHGFTFFVTDLKDASVFVGDTELLALTKNAPDECGRASITIVDTSSPTTIFDSNLYKNRNEGVILSDEKGQFSFTVDSDISSAHNTPYIQIETDSNFSNFSEINIHIETENGDVLISNCTIDNCIDFDGFKVNFLLSEYQDSSQAVVALYDRDLSAKNERCESLNYWRECDVISGDIYKLTISGKINSANSIVHISAIRLLRPNPQSVSNTQGFVIGGRILGGSEAEGSKVVLKGINRVYEASTKIESDGMFKFVNVPKALQFSIQLETSNGDRCERFNKTYLRAERSSLDYDIKARAFDCYIDRSEIYGMNKISLKFGLLGMIILSFLGLWFAPE